MKKLLTAALAAILCLGVLAGCGNKNDSAGGMEMKEGQTVQTVTDSIVEQVGIAMGAPVDETAIENLFYLKPDDVESFAGQLSMVNVSADNIVGIKAKPDTKDAVRQGMEKRLQDVKNSFENYLPEQYEKAQKGQVLEKGDYFFLLILGESTETYDADMAKAVEIINEAF